MPKTLKGACACGAVTYRLTSPPLFVNCCHCKDCQRQTGSAFVINAIIETARIKSKGVTEDIAMPTESGRPHIVSRCPACKTALWSDYGGRKIMRFLRVGTLDDPSALPPDAHIFTRSKLRWVDLKNPARGATTKKPALVVKVYYNMKKDWPASSLARRAALGL
ncbi:MAG TPA: GFA family protein [Rhizomicrobium sp.]|jgi:hypothetical protein|nr:GFA family protein [Rhizomicrobium sp.]